jgi:hypothetical protein
LGLDLRSLNERLFVDARQALTGASIEIQGASSRNLVVKILTESRTVELPVNKNLLFLDGERIELEGLVVCSPPTESGGEQRVFLPQQAVQRILGRTDPLPSVELGKAKPRKRVLTEARAASGR